MRSFFIAAMLAAQTPNELIYEMEPDQVFLSYQAELGSAQISGVSRALEWSAVVLPGSAAQVQLRVPVDSFDSGHPEMDSRVRDALGSKRFPEVVVEGVARDGHFLGTVTMHGFSHALSAPLSAERRGASLVVRTSFAIALDAFHVTPPQGADNRVQVDFVARLHLTPTAVLGGGSVN
jgi:hypothetical protein